MHLPKLTECITLDPAHLLIGTDIFTQVANGSGIAPVARDVVLTTEIDRSKPISGIKILVNFMADVAAASLTPDGIGSLLKQVQFQRNQAAPLPGQTSKRAVVPVVNCRGVDILQYRNQTSNLDRSTQAALTTVPAIHVLGQIVYDLDLALDQLPSPLHEMSACPVHLDSGSPTLRLTMATQADMDFNAVPTFKLQLLTVEIQIERVDMPEEFTNQVLADGGFLETEFISKDFPITAAGERVITLDTPGEFTHWMFTTYTGSQGTTQARGDVTSTANRLWTLSQAKVPKRVTTLPQLQSLNDESKIQTTTGLFSNNYMFDFISDGGSASERNLGSLLNTDLQMKGQDSTLKFVAATPGAFVPKVAICQRRFLTPISPARRFGQF